MERRDHKVEAAADHEKEKKIENQGNINISLKSITRA
jgi:hypothetical protein